MISYLSAYDLADDNFDSISEAHVISFRRKPHLTSRVWATAEQSNLPQHPAQKTVCLNLLQHPQQTIKALHEQSGSLRNYISDLLFIFQMLSDLILPEEQV